MTNPFNATATTTPNPDQTSQPQHPDIQPFPPPQTFTFLPQLYTLISHLAPLQSPSHKDTASTTTTSRTSRSPTLTRRPAADQNPPTSAGTDAPLSLTQTRSRDETVEIKDLPELVYPLRQQIERAREVVAGLPDVGRSVAEQEREIEVLEGRVRGLRGRVGVLAGLAESRGKGDVVMMGVEGHE